MVALVGWVFTMVFLLVSGKTIRTRKLLATVLTLEGLFVFPTDMMAHQLVLEESLFAMGAFERLGVGDLVALKMLGRVHPLATHPTFERLFILGRVGHEMGRQMGLAKEQFITLGTLERALAGVGPLVLFKKARSVVSLGTLVTVVHGS